jgi:hypothetical protein
MADNDNAAIDGAASSAKPKQSVSDLVEAQVGGVQGASDDEADTASPAQDATKPETTPDAPAPDSAEIEWAGSLVKKPPSP